MNHGDVAFAGSIQDWLRTEDVPHADVIVGGPPCQGFSSLGKQDIEDARNQLWLWYAHTIYKAEPKYFIIENVATFLSSPQLLRFKRQTNGKGRLRAYTFRARILNAADYGTAQVRRRAVVIGHHRDLDFPGFPQPTHDRDSWPTVKQALSDLPERVHQIALPDRWIRFANIELPGPFRTDQLHLTRSYEPISLERFGYIGEGENRFKIPDHLLAPCWRNHTTGSADVMGRLSWDKPSVTIRTEFFKPEKGRYLHPREHRALTHHEAARLQASPTSISGWARRRRWHGRSAMQCPSHSEPLSPVSCSFATNKPQLFAVLLHAICDWLHDIVGRRRQSPRWPNRLDQALANSHGTQEWGR